jgi:hypothetical protein
VTVISRLPRVLGLVAATVTLAACGTTVGTAEESAPSPVTSTPATGSPAAAPAEPSPSPSTAPAATAEPTQPVSGADMAGHIHNLTYDGRQLLIGTHEGLWAQDPGATPAQVSVEAFDVMGFTPAADRWLASGHPGAGMDAPADLGLLESTDQGRTWSEVSLGGEVDFHRLVTSGDVVVGLNAHDGRLLRSDDGGAAWADLGVPELYDLAISPTDPSVIVGTTENGPVRSTDSGATFQPITGAPLLALLAWTGETLYGAHVDGQVSVSRDDGATWSPMGSLPAQPAALAATATTVSALVGDTVLESVDGARSFAPRITDLAGH